MTAIRDNVRGTSILGAVLLGLWGVPAEVVGQIGDPVVPRQVGQVEALQLVRSNRAVDIVSRILTDTTRSPAEIEAFADSLVRITREHLAADPDSPLGTYVLEIFRTAARGLGGRSYSGAANRHLQLYRGVDNPTFRAAALSSMQFLDIPSARYLEILTEGVLQDDLSSLTAISLLASRGPTGFSRLQHIYQNRLGKVRNALALRQLRAIALHRGWQKTQPLSRPNV